MSAARCSHCGRDLPTGFPGASVTCICGATTTHPAVTRPPTGPSFHPHDPHSAPAMTSAGGPVSGPYRGAGVMPGEPPPDADCPFCGNPCPALVRVCPHCDVRLDNVRCAGCYTLQTPGSFSCARCGRRMELEPLLDPTDAPCPRCTSALEAEGGRTSNAPASPVGLRSAESRIHECPRCGGMFVPQDVLAEILAHAEGSTGLPEPVRRPSSMLDPVTYLPCPLCHDPMNRANFGRVSGVIVDVCRKHGTWFDGGELTRVVSFAANGGLAKTRARALEEKKQAEAKQHAARVELVVSQNKYEAEERLAYWRDFLHRLL